MIIQPDEIKTKANRWYNTILSSSIQSTPEFPQSVPFTKVKAKDTLKNFASIGKEIEALVNGSKDKKGYGYKVFFVQRNDRKIGKQSFPDKILFETLEDYLKFLSLEEEYNQFLRITQKLIKEFPQLIPWVESKPNKVIENFGKWEDIIKVCKYFLENPQPKIYIREIPLDISTKFIEDNKTIISNLLDILIEDHINKDDKGFYRRYNLKFDEELVRIRILDSEIARNLFSGVDDLSVPQSKFSQLDIPCKRVFVLENKTNLLNFLTLLSLKDSVAIFGKGFGVGALKDATWLSNKQIIYWGDIDPHGFQILSQVRGYFLHTQSCMMDFDTFMEFEYLAITGAYTNVTELQNLTHEEHLLFEHLSSLENNNRLEQEKIPHEYVLKKIHDIVNNDS